MTTSNNNGLERESNGVRDLITKYIPYWPLFILLLMISGTALYFYLKFTPAVYETTASVLIKDESKGQKDSEMEEVLNVFGTKKIVENELEIFHSNSLISSVVKILNLYAPIYEERGWRGMGTTSAYLTSPIIIDLSNPNEIEETPKVYFDYSKPDSAVVINGSKYPLNQWVNSPWGTLRFLPNPHYYPATRKSHEPFRYYFQLITLDHATNGVLGSLQVSAASKQASIINLSYKDQIPARGEAIITQVVAAYNKASAERKSSVAIRTLKFIEDRLKTVSKELDSVENSIQSFKDNKGVVDIGEQGKMYLQNIESTDKEISTLNLQESALDEVRKYVESKSASGNIVPSTFNINDPTLNQLLTNLSSAQSQYEKLKRTTAENNPIMLSLQEEINRLKPNILENIQNQERNIAAAKSTLTGSKERYSTMLSSVPQKERQLIEVSRQHNIKNDIYSFLLQKKEETAYSITSILPDCYMVSNPTTSSTPVSPKKLFLALLAFAAPIMVGILLISVKDIFNGKVLYRTDIEKLSQFPIIGEIIHEKLKSTIVTENAERSFIIEQFRLIRTGLKHHKDPSGRNKRILVTSCIKGDGKSFVSSNLAMSLARSGKKVALLEMDLHQPRLCEVFNVERGNGIADYLAGFVEVEDIIVPTVKHDNVYMVQAGHPADEPSELLVKDRMELLLNYLDKSFDYLIVDTAPLKVLTDALIIAPHCHLVLTVIRHNHTPKSHLEMLDKDLISYGITNVALIFNDVKNRGFGKYSYGYGHGYGYDIRSSYEEYGKKRRKIS